LLNSKSVASFFEEKVFAFVQNENSEKEKEKTPMEVGHLGVASGEREVEAGARGKVEGGLKWVSVGRF
jgi:hypothetical protein